MDRRQFAVETGVRAFGEILACRDSASAAYCKWLCGGLIGIASDLTEALDFANKAAGIAQLTAQAMVEGSATLGGASTWDRMRA